MAQLDNGKARLNSINKVLPKKEGVTRRKLGELLLETGLLSPEKLTEALNKQKNSGKRLGQQLIEMNVISEEEMAFALAMQLKIPYVDLTYHQIPLDVMETIPEEVSRKFICVPIALNSSILDVAMADPLDLNMMKDLQFITGYSIQPAISTGTQILDLLQDIVNRPDSHRSVYRGCLAESTAAGAAPADLHEKHRSEERRVGKECRSRWSPYH